MVFAGCADLRIVNNRMACPNLVLWEGCAGPSSYWDAATSTEFFAQDQVWLGNEIYDIAKNQSDNGYAHSLYFGTDAFNIDAGWNYLHDNQHGCRGIQVHSSPTANVENGWVTDPTGKPLYNLDFHDNWIVDQPCDGINLATVDPSLGKVWVRNNVVVRSAQHDTKLAGIMNINSGILVAGEDNHPYASAAPGCVWAWNPSNPTLITGTNCGFKSIDNIQVGWAICYDQRQGVNSRYDACSSAYISTVDDDNTMHLFTIPDGYANRPFQKGNPPGAVSNQPFVYFKSGRGSVEVIGNTLYDNSLSTWRGGGWCRLGQSPLLTMHMVGNIVAQKNGQRWSCGREQVNGDGTYYVTGDHNLFYNYGTPQAGDTIPSFLQTAAQFANPLFLNPEAMDFTIASNSPALGHGGTTNAINPKDIRGLNRPTPPAIGAYEYMEGPLLTPDTCSITAPTLDAVITSVPYTFRGTGTAGQGNMANFTFYLDGALLGAQSGTGPYSQVGSPSDGPHTISCTCSDSLGGTGTCTGVTFTVNTAPVAAHASVTGKVTGKLNH